jgi:hypothetical protein
LCVPGVSRFTTHPFTIACACDEASTGVGARGREIVLIIRARTGFTRMLWEEIVHGSGHHAQTSTGKERRGILLRATIDGPFGSSVREDWDRYSSALLVAGGSGVAFALSVLEALCLRIVNGGKEVKTKRIRFVWMIREYGASLCHACCALADVWVQHMCNGARRSCAGAAKWSRAGRRSRLRFS